MSYLSDGCPLLFVANDFRGSLAQGLQDVGLLLASSTVADTLDLYVDPVAGNDANPGTSALPLATLPVALNKIPATWRRKVRVHLAAGTFPLGTQFSWFAGIPVGVTVAGDGGPVGPSPANAPDSFGGAGRNVTFIGTYAPSDSGTITSVTTSGSYVVRITDASKSWAANSQEGAICRFTSGAAVGVAFRIRESGATTLDPLYPVGTAPVPSAGDAYVIEAPASIVSFTVASFYGVQSARDVGLSFDGVAFQPAAASAQLVFNGTSVYLNGVTVGSAAFASFLFFANCEIQFAGNQRSDLDLGGGLRTKVGLYANRCTVDVARSGAYRHCALLLRGASTITCQYDNSLLFQAIDAKGGAKVVVRYGSYLNLAGANLAAFACFRISGATNPITVDGASTMKLALGSMDVSNNTGPGVLVDQGGLFDAAGAVVVGGTGNSTYGVSCQHFGRMIANPNVSLTGTSGDCIAGATAGTWAAINGGTALTEAKSQTAIIPNA